MTGDHAIQPLREDDPRELGAYRVLGRIGRGGMGIVYLAESASGERAALKVISPDLADDESFRDRFRREVESARRVRRFCTAPVLDAKLDGDPLYIVTEYVDGPDLDRFIRETGRMTGSSLEHLAVGVATALSAIHGAGVVHRDLKPENVLLSSVGPRVIDFGIARALDSVSHATRTGTFIGTPAYMAPEVITGAGKASPASDVFAWGCIVAYAGTGHPPFGGDTLPAILYQVSHGEPQLEGLDPSLREVVGHALAKDPQQRPSAQQILDRLTGRPGADTRQVADDVTRSWISDTRQDAPQFGQAPTMAMAPGNGTRPATRANRRPLIIGAAAVAVLIVLAIGAYLLLRSPGPPSGTTVYSDDYSNGDSGWDKDILGTDYGYINGGYHFKAGDTDPREYKRAPFNGTVPTRILISADTKFLSGPPYGQLGFYCRGSGDGPDSPSYDFLIRSDGNGTVIRKEAGQSGSKQLAGKSSTPGFKKGKKNHLQAACEQDGKSVHLRLWVNGELAAETTDGNAPLGNGGVGLLAAQEQGNPKVDAFFDNFDMSQIH